jgi:signal peptidase I
MSPFQFLQRIRKGVCSKILSESATATRKDMKRIILIGSCLIASVFVLRLFFLVSRVQGDSMLPTFHNGDWMLVSKRAFARQEPRRGEIVVSHYRGELIVKRVLGLPGEQIEIQSGKLFINGVPQPEPYGLQMGSADVGKGTLAPGKFALMGDNRGIPSRQMIAAVAPQDQIVGKVVYWFRL